MLDKRGKKKINKKLKNTDQKKIICCDIINHGKLFLFEGLLSPPRK